MKRRSIILVALGVSLALGGGGLALNGPATSNSSASESSLLDESATSTAQITRGDLSTSREFNAKASFGEAFDAPIDVTGIITQQRVIGSIVDFGESFIRVDDTPVYLAEGSMPLYRDLYKVDTRGRDSQGNRRTYLEGKDVRQLQAFLIDAGFNADKRLEVDGIFGKSTEKAVEAWQESVGIEASGRITSGQLVFSPDPLRIASESRIGAPFVSLQVSAAEATVTIDTNNRDRGDLPLGALVTVELPDGTQLDGEVVEQEQVTANDGSRVWRTTLGVKGSLTADASSAQVTATRNVASDVLLVPVSALLALSEGGFAVEISADGLSTLVRVEIGEVLDGLAEVSGEINEGDIVVVPV